MLGKNFNILSYSDKKKYINNNKIIVINKLDDSEFFINSPSNKITGIIINNKKYINLLNKLGKGSYGNIYKFSNINSSEKEFFAVKEYFEVKDYLIEKVLTIILKNMREVFNINFNLINSYWNDKNSVCIMDGYDNDLYTLVYNKNIKYNPFEISIQVIKSINHLYKYGIYYCDLKLANILYNFKDNKINCTLADIGSLNFSKNNIYTNLFYSNDLLNNRIKLKKTRKLNLCRFEIEHNDKFYSIGLVFVPHLLYLELSNSKIFTIKDIKDNKVMLEGNETSYFIDSMYFTLSNAIFTFPHVINYNGEVEFTDNLNFVNIITNNLLQSIAVFIIELIFKSDFKLRFEQILCNFNQSVTEIKETIKFSKLGIKDKIILNNLIFGKFNTYGLLNEDYINDIEFTEYMDYVIKNLKILEKNFDANI